MINTTNYFTDNNASEQKIKANVTVNDVSYNVVYSSIGSEFIALFNNNKNTLNNLIAALSNTGVYFTTTGTFENNSKAYHIRKDVHYNGN